MSRKTTAMLLVMLSFVAMIQAAPTSMVRFKKVSVNDQPNMIGGEAFSFLVPADWRVEGGMVWRLHPQIPAAAAIRVSDPKSLAQLEMFPTVGFSWGGILAQTGFRQGANYLGNEVQPPARDAIQYLKIRHLPRVRGNLPARIVAEQELPELARAVAQAESLPAAAGPVPRFSAGRVRIGYEWKGQVVEEDFYAVINTGFFPDGSTVQVADKLCAMRAEKGRLDDQIKLFQTILFSIRPNLQWVNQYVQLCHVLTQMGMQQIRSAGELSRIISRNNREISDIIRRGYEERQASQDRINKNWSQYIRGVEQYSDPVTGRSVVLPSGYRYAGINSQGEYVVSDDPNSAPDLRPLQKAGN